MVAAAGRWRWLRDVTTKARDVTTKVACVGAGLLQVMGERQYQILCVKKFHRDEVRCNRARAALALGQHGKITMPHRSPGVSVLQDQDQHREDLAEDAVCARAVELIYAPSGDTADWHAHAHGDMIDIMESEFAERVFLPDAKAASIDEATSDWNANAYPKWAVVRLKHGVLRGGVRSEGVLVVFRGTHSWEDTMHDLLCIPIEHTSGVMLHRGVALAVSRAAPLILPALRQAMHGWTSPRVIITGHSYGGALALALQLHSLVDEDWEHVTSVSGGVSSVTFGAPLVFGCGGSKDSESYLQRIHAFSRQYVHQGDVVPRLLGRQGQVLLQALSAWRASQTAPNGEGIGVAGWWELFKRGGEGEGEEEGEGEGEGGAFVSASCEGPGAGGEERGQEGSQTGQRCGVVNAALNVAARVVGDYQPVGSFRFVYTVPGDPASPGCGHYIRISKSEDETHRLLQLDLGLIWFIYLLVRDHSTDDYRSKVSPHSTVVSVLAPGLEDVFASFNIEDDDVPHRQYIETHGVVHPDV